MLVSIAACASERIADHDEVYYGWDDRRVLCGVSIDDGLGNSIENITEGLARAAERREVLVLYAHEPGDSISTERLEAVLAAAAGLGLEFVTFADLALGPRTPRGGVAVTFDDSFVTAWHDSRELFANYQARVTFFVTRFDRQVESSTGLSKLEELRDDGHAIESHGLRHIDAPAYVADHGLQAYVADELLPSLQVMRQLGFEPTSFSYPYGARTSELDSAILDHVHLVRSLAWMYPYPFIQHPCP